MMPTLLGKSSDLMQCFRSGGGLTFDDFGTEHMLHGHRLAVREPGGGEGKGRVAVGIVRGGGPEAGPEEEQWWVRQQGPTLSPNVVDACLL
jgi:hypothetical protein